MNTCDGRLYDQEQMQRMDALMRKFLVPVDAEKLTPKQTNARQVSVHDHRSPVGIQLTAARHVGRNEPCPCGSGKKFKFCHLNV